jgi:hypothetical protein
LCSLQQRGEIMKHSFEIVNLFLIQRRFRHSLQTSLTT